MRKCENLKIFKFSNLQILIALAVVIAMSGCRPKGILSSRKMRNVLYDLHRAEAIIQVTGMYYGHNEELARYYEVVLDKNNVTKAQFDSSLVWYTDHPQIFNKIYPKVLKRCEEETQMWNETFAQMAAAGAAKRNLPPLEEVTQRLQNGWDTQLYLGELPPQELLLPLQTPDSTAAAETTPSDNGTAVGTSQTQQTESVEEEFPNDSLTPDERRRQNQFEFILRRFQEKHPAQQKDSVEK